MYLSKVSSHVLRTSKLGAPCRTFAEFYITLLCVLLVRETSVLLLQYLWTLSLFKFNASAFFYYYFVLLLIFYIQTFRRQKSKYNYISFKSLSFNYDFKYWTDDTIVNSISHNELFVKSYNGAHIFTALIVLEDSPHYLIKQTLVGTVSQVSQSLIV